MDEIHLEKVLGGDIQAFRYFVEQYQEMAYQVAISILKEESLAADVVQESFFLAYRKLSSFGRRSRFSTWLMRIVINEALKVHKDSGKTPLWTGNEISEEADDGTGALERLGQKEQAYYIELALKSLAPKEALALKLYYLQEFSIAELREATGWSEANTKVILHRARKHMYGVLDHLLKAEKKEIY